MATAAPIRRPPHDRGERMVDLFAEQLSIDGDVPTACAQLGIRQDYGRQMLRRIRSELGWQAV